MKKTDSVRTADGSRFRFNYRGTHRYLIKLPVFSSRDVFINEEVVLTVLTALRDACRKHQFDIYAYCFLPGQLVMIARGKSEQSNMKEFLSTFRTTSSEAVTPSLGHPLWSAKYLERVLRKMERNRDIAAEIFQLPVKAHLVSTPEEYPLRGSFVFPLSSR